MAKNQARTPGRDVRGGKGKGGRQRGEAQAARARGGSAHAGGRGASAAGRQGRPGQRPGRGDGPRPGVERPSRPDGQTVRPSEDYIEGRRACAEALEAGIPLRRALVSAGSDGADPTLASLVGRLADAGVPVQTVPRAKLDAISSHGAHQGIAVQVRPYTYASLEDVVEASGQGPALVLVLDHVTDEGNFGAIVRSAEVVGAAGVVIPKVRSAGVGVGAYKTSAGAALHLPIVQVPNLATALDRLKGAGFWVAGGTEHAEQDLWHAPLEGRLALVVGSEGDGISRLVREKCDFECRLPQRGRVESLNVAQATTALCYEWLRRTMAGEADE